MVGGTRLPFSRIRNSKTGLVNIIVDARLFLLQQKAKNLRTLNLRPELRSRDTQLELAKSALEKMIFYSGSQIFLKNLWRPNSLI